jgi:hypothetical protein
VATQFRLFDPWDADRPARMPVGASRDGAAEQLVLDLALRAGGDVDGSEVYRAGEALGISTDELSAAVARLTAARRLEMRGTRLVLAAA